MPQPTGEFGIAPAILWIPEQLPTASVVATFRADAAAGGNKLTLVLMGDPAGASASVWRSTSDEFETRTSLTEAPVPLGEPTFEYLDRTAAVGRTYYYWVQLHEADGTSFWNGPVAATFHGAASLTFAAPARPNPVVGRTEIAYAVGADIAGSGPVAVRLALHDLLGRRVRVLHEGRQGMGQYSVHWDGRDESGRSVGAGVYYLHFAAGPVRQTSKVSVVR
jgi:hypothetical protein